MKSQYAMAQSIAAYALTTNSKGETLIGFDAEGHITIPGFVLKERMRENPQALLLRAEAHLLGPNYTSQSVQEVPLVLCTSARSGNIAADPFPGQNLNLIYIYRKVVQGVQPITTATPKFHNSSFVGYDYFKKECTRRGKMAELINRSRSKFMKEFMWPEFANCLREVTPFGTLEAQLKRCNFAPDFIASQLKLNALRWQHPQLASVA